MGPHRRATPGRPAQTTAWVKLPVQFNVREFLPSCSLSSWLRHEDKLGLAPAHSFGFERLSDTEVVPAHSDDLLPGLLQDNVDTTVRLLPGVPSIAFLKKSFTRTLVMHDARRTPLSWRPSPAPTLTPPRLRNVLISCFQVRPVFLLFQKVESTPGFLANQTFTPTTGGLFRLLLYKLTSIYREVLTSDVSGVGREER